MPESIEVQVGRLEQKVEDLIRSVELQHQEMDKDFASIDRKLSDVQRCMDGKTSQIIHLEAKVQMHDKVFWLLVTPVLGAIGLAVWNVLR